MVTVTARAKPRNGWSTSLRNEDSDVSDDDAPAAEDSPSSGAAAAAARGQGSDWDWNWSSELIDIGLVDEPPQLRFRPRQSPDKGDKKKLAATPTASTAAAVAGKVKPTTSTTTPAPHQSAALPKNKNKQDSLPLSDVQQRAALPVTSQPWPPKDSLRATPIAQQQSHANAASSKARLVSSSRFRPASTSSPTVFSRSSSSQPRSSSATADKAWLATATATETDTEDEQAPLASAHCDRPAAGLATKSTARVKHPVRSSADLVPPKDRLPPAASSSYPVGTGGSDPLAHKSPPSQAKSTTRPCSSSKPVSAPVATTKDSTNNDAVESPYLAPPRRRRRGDDEKAGDASAAETFAAPVNVDNKLPSTAKPNQSNAVRSPPPPPPPTTLPFVFPLVGRRRPLKLQQQSFPEQEEQDTAESLITASFNPQQQPQQQQRSRDRYSDLFLLPHMHTRQVLPSQVQDAARASPSSSFSTAGPSSSSSSKPPFVSSTTTAATTTEANSLRTTHWHHEGSSPETRKRLDRFKRVGNFSSSSSSSLASTSAATEVEPDPGRLLPLSRRDDDDDGPSLNPTTPVPDRSALSGGPVNDDSDPRSSIHKVSTKFSLPGFGTAEVSSGSSSLQTKKKRSRLDFTPFEPLEVFQQKKKKNAHVLSSSSSPSPDDDGAWNDEPVSPTPVFPTGGPSQRRRQQQRHQVQAQPRRETIVLGTAVRSVRPVSIATAAAATTGNNSLRRLCTYSSSSSSSSVAPKRSQPGGFKRLLAAARTRGDFSIRCDDEDDDRQLAEERAKHESEDAKRRRLYRSLGL